MCARIRTGLPAAAGELACTQEGRLIGKSALLDGFPIRSDWVIGEAAYIYI